MDKPGTANSSLPMKSVCRICGSRGIYDIFQSSTNENTLCVMLQDCSKIQVEEDDLLPSKLCRSCTKELIRGFEFLQTCNQSFEVFLTIANKLDSYISRTRNEETEIETDFLTTLRNYYAEFITAEEVISEQNLADLISKLKSEYVCRVCLSRSSTSIFQMQYKDWELATLYEECTALKIKRGDDLPQFICHTCMTELVRLHDFKTNCEQSCEAFLKALEESPDFASKCRESEEKTIKSDPDSIPIQEIDISFLLEDNYPKGSSIIRNNCQHCYRNFPTYTDLLLHKKLTNHNHPDRIQCQLCQMTFILEDHLRMHMKVHAAKHPFECSVCFKGFTFNSNLKRHMRIHNGERPYVCECCGKSFTQAGSLQSHMQIHAHVKKYKCTICPKNFYSSTALKTHIREHEEGDKTEVELTPTAQIKVVKTFKCNTCGKILASRNSYQIHLNMHMGVRPYSCEMCHKTFTQSTGLRNHMRIHSGEKPHVCPVCERAFTQSSQLGYHLKTHSGEKNYTCRFCTKAFALKGNLVVHERIHTGEIPYVCEICEKGFTNSSALKKHKRAVHGYSSKDTSESEALKNPVEIDVWTEGEKSSDYYEEV